MKLTSTIYDPDNILDFDCIERATRKKEILGSNGEARDTASHKIILLVTAPNIQENYENCQIFFPRQRYMKCSLPFREDLKLRDIVSGLKCQSILKVFFCRFGCGICDCNLGFFPDAQSSKTTLAFQVFPDYTEACPDST